MPWASSRRSGKRCSRARPSRPPQRIHKLARLVEILLKQDVEAGLAPLAALVVSRVRGGLPAPGFFDRAARLGIFDGSDPARFHSELLAVLFDSTGNPR